MYFLHQSTERLPVCMYVSLLTALEVQNDTAKLINNKYKKWTKVNKSITKEDDKINYKWDHYMHGEPAWVDKNHKLTRQGVLKIKLDNLQILRWNFKHISKKA